MEMKELFNIGIKISMLIMLIVSTKHGRSVMILTIQLEKRVRWNSINNYSKAIYVYGSIMVIGMM